jgi:intracellular sulfur oxidation DsrE/DsrF family protein
LAVLISAGAQAATTLEQVLSAPEPPSGVVFEIVEGDEGALQALMPQVHRAIARLRERFPGVDIAIVSHGGEQFSLQAKRAEEYPELHREVQSLVADEVPVHVCGVHAGWYGVEPEDFPDYVDVAASGPAQIRQYEALGFETIRIATDD